MYLFKEPKLNRIARNLQSDLGSVVSNYQAILLAKEDSQDPNTSHWYRKRKDFSWAVLMLDVMSCFSGKISVQEMERTWMLTEFYKSHFENAKSIYSELQNKTPNYDKIIHLAKEIKNDSSSIPAKSGEGKEDYQLPYSAGGNFLFNLMMSVFGLLYIPAMALAGLFLIPAYLNGTSEYCGSPEFFFHAAVIFIAMVVKLISLLIFPIAILQSKYETDSVNVFKGRFMRQIDSIISLAEEAKVEKESKVAIEMGEFVSH